MKLNGNFKRNNNIKKITQTQQALGKFSIFTNSTILLNFETPFSLHCFFSSFDEGNEDDLLSHHLDGALEDEDDEPAELSEDSDCSI